MPFQNDRPRRGKSSPNSTFRAAGAVALFDSHRLTPREIQVVELIVAGKRNNEIGRTLKCSPRTVQEHVQHILRKLNLETRRPTVLRPQPSRYIPATACGTYGPSSLAIVPG